MSGAEDQMQKSHDSLPDGTCRRVGEARRVGGRQKETTATRLLFFLLVALVPFKARRGAKHIPQSRHDVPRRGRGRRAHLMRRQAVRAPAVRQWRQRMPLVLPQCKPNSPFSPSVSFSMTTRTSTGSSPHACLFPPFISLFPADAHAGTHHWLSVPSVR